MAIIVENQNEITQQTPITTSEATYILENGSIGVDSDGAALDISSTGLSGIAIILWTSLIENLAGEGIQSSSSARIEIGSQSSIRTGDIGIRFDTAGTVLDLVNYGSILATGTTAAAIFATGSARIVNFGNMRGGTTGISVGEGATIQNAGTIEGTVISISFVGGAGSTLVNSGLISGRIALSTGADTVVNSGTIRVASTTAISATSGSQSITNTGTIIGSVILGSGSGEFKNSGYLSRFLICGDGTDFVFNSGTIDSFVELGGGNDQYSGPGFVRGGVDGQGGEDIISGSAHDDNFVGGDDNDQLSGLGGDDVLSGGNHDDLLEGGAGADLLLGSAGSDTLLGGSGADGLDGGIGTDAASYTSSLRGVTVSLANDALNTGDAAGDSFTAIEDLTGSNFNDHLIGDGRANTLRGQSGNDRLDGGAGADTLIGEAGNDTYLVDNAGDQLVEAAFGGTDAVFAAANYTLGAFNEIEIFRVSGAAGRTLNGNGFGQQILGANGADTLRGFAGADTLNGGLGKDFLAGGADNDVFKFSAKSHSALGVNADRILDFDDAGNDTIDLSSLFGPALVYRHTGAFTTAGQVRINDIAGADVIVEVNTGGSLEADFSIRLVATTLTSMNASDFVL